MEINKKLIIENSIRFGFSSPSLLDELNEKKKKNGDPCWDGYKMVGMKKKKGKKVPNCVPLKNEDDSEPTEKNVIIENENKPLNKPMKGDVKKYKVYVKNEKGNIIKVEFGDPNMEIKRDDPERRKSFRARHKCDTANDKTSARYWSCKMWQKNKTVKDMLN